MPLRTTRHRPIMAARWPANTAKGRVRGERLRFSLWSTLDRGLCKSGVRFLAFFLGPRLRKRMLRGRIPGPPGGPRFFFPAFFFRVPRRNLPQLCALTAAVLAQEAVAEKAPGAESPAAGALRCGYLGRFPAQDAAASSRQGCRCPAFGGNPCRHCRRHQSKSRCLAR